MARSRIVACVLAGVHTSQAISEETGIPARTTRRKLKLLVEEGVLFRRGKRMTATYHVEQREAADRN
jgi:transcription initiation factor IIE alpha subunit